MKYLSRKIPSKTLLVYILFLLSIYTYNEVYQYHSKKWNQLDCKQKCNRILLVADPQLIGLKNEVLHFLTPLTIWDSDRYLRKTYEDVYKFTEPDIVIFLGDLFDEGSTATNSEYKSYADRFFNVFNIPSNFAKTIYIPGDNDIGGEGYEIVKGDSLMNFEDVFFQQDVLDVGTNTFYKINRLTKTWPKMQEDKEFYKVDKIRIGLSHVPLIFQPGGFVEKVIRNLEPHVIFAAHEHKSMIVTMDGILQTVRKLIPVSEEDNDVYTFTLGMTDMYEFVVPTCSYRMGTKRIGYGFATIENGEINYTVLWSPSRLDQLKNYAWIGGLSLIYFLYRCIVSACKYCCKKTKSSTSSTPSYIKIENREN
ncbi:PREDICTED: uncharacterized protein C630.12 isoform X2 [Nicrophorus vespilloides]|uniref:Uncharacterized protein C630.12 isoform X2 n=1 Tax=Nicrophorus vespilloides TaxID=110193 RepID=A0ABM1MTB7_NICVS|nr:PREDICTED: uncharacterized protein C630.12 isoform X2 [Nicrophorus vespilloides]